MAEQKQMDALYAEAEKVHRAFFAADAELALTGDAASPAAVELLTDPAKSLYVAQRQRQHDLNITGRDEYRLVYVRRSASDLVPGSVVALEHCVDGTHVVGFSGSKQLGPDSFIAGVSLYSRVGGALRISQFKTKAVSSC